MKYLILALIITIGTTSISSAEYVNGYMKKDGTYVQGYNRTSADDSKLNNYSTQGNTNPYNGNQGTVNPYNNNNNLNQPSSNRELQQRRNAWGN